MFIQAVAEVPIPVSSPDRALAFCGGTLGLELARADEIGPGVRRIQLAPRGGASVLTLATWPESMPPGCLRDWCSDQATCKPTTTGSWPQAWSPTAHPAPVPATRAEAVFCDPDGNKFVLRAGQRPLADSVRHAGAIARNVADRRNARMA